MNICSQCGKTEREQQHELCYRIDCWRQFRFRVPPEYFGREEKSIGVESLKITQRKSDSPKNNQQQ